VLPDDARTSLAERLRALEEAGDSGILLVTRAGEPVVEACFGLADRAAGLPVTPRTRFGTASVTKMLTAVAVLDLVARGQLTLTTPVVDVVPPERRPRELSPAVTVHHLLCHTSGIADYFEEDEDLPNAGEDYGDLWLTLPPRRAERPADFLPLYADLPAYSPPGEVTRYSNAGYVLLGELLEQATGAAFVDVVTERVLRRAGMDDSGFFRSDDPQPDTAVGYLPSGRTNVHHVPVVGGGDGGCLCTAADLARFVAARADGTLLGDLTEVALRPQADCGQGFWFGYGVLLYPDGRWGHGGGDPGVSALVNHWPDHDVTVVTLCNVEEVDERDPAVELRHAFLSEWGAHLG
jgi:D-alanyl-D-alanine carboxypeptidase